MSLSSDIESLDKKVFPSTLFYDWELEKSFADVKRLYDTFKRAKKRFERKETIQISKSMCDYIQKCKDVELNPYILYKFDFGSDRICLCQERKIYYVYVSVSDLSIYKQKFSDCFKFGNFFGGYDTLSSAITLYAEMVMFYFSDFEVLPF